MKLAYWMYAGPAHIGTLRVASSFKNVHAIMHAPLGDDYFNVMRSMLERERDFTPVTASIVDRHVLARGSQEKVVENITRKDKEEQPDLIVLTPTCTSSILQEDLQNFVNRASLSSNSDVLLADVNHYRVNELQAADRTLEQIVRYYLSEKKNANNSNQSTQINPNSDLEHINTEELTTHQVSLNEACSQVAGTKHEKLRQCSRSDHPSANIIGIFTLGFHNQHDCRELKRLLNDLGIQINEIIPEGASVHNLKNLPKAWFNIVPYREVGLMTASFLKKEYDMPFVSITPMGVLDTAAFIREIANILISPPFLSSFESWFTKHDISAQNLAAQIASKQEGSLNQNSTDEENSAHTSQNLSTANKLNSPSFVHSNKTNEARKHPFTNGTSNQSLQFSSPEQSPSISNLATTNFKDMFLHKIDTYINQQTLYVSQAAWFSRSIDCQNLTGKRVVVFGDATHASSMTKILAREMGIRVVCAGTYCKHDADWFREQVSGFCDQVLITDDHTQVGDIIALVEPSAIFGTQMERHVGKRLDIPCGVISAPVHIQNFTLSYRPFLGYEGTNQIADLVYNSFSLGMEDHLLEIFGGHDTKQVVNTTLSTELSTDSDYIWLPEAIAELNRVPGFVRGKVKRNTEKFAPVFYEKRNIKDKKQMIVTLDVMYGAKEAFS